MCFEIDTKAASLNKRIVWKVFDKQGGKIVSLYEAATYPKGKLVERSVGPTEHNGSAVHGLYFYLSKADAKREATEFPNVYIAKFTVSPKDFLFASACGRVATYERATRVGNFIRVG